MTSVDEWLEIVKPFSERWVSISRHVSRSLGETLHPTYLLLRGIDEIEDDPALSPGDKAWLLAAVGDSLLERDRRRIEAPLLSRRYDLPEVSLRIGEWAAALPEGIGPRVVDAASNLAHSMSRWARCEWSVHTEADLGRYAYQVAGSLMMLYGDIWSWHGFPKIPYRDEVAFGQYVSIKDITVDRDEDLAAGRDLWPTGWGKDEMTAYADSFRPAARRCREHYGQGTEPRQFYDIVFDKAELQGS
ncbi:squalene/phytoene synthase family protein [Streptomyces sp. NPDC050617]|uniref:squalene/phytoene synthase family protein n=1 Tax=Streptomyces sp. NPDC050617 TaxID=3154628 RepID=UPI0034345DA2